jgi:hypothetical protein
MKNCFSDNMTFENEFFEMAQALEENSEMINIQNKLSDSQVNKNFYSFSSLFLFQIETCIITFNYKCSIF